MPTNFHVGDHAPLLASQKENEWPREDHTNPFAQPERTGIARVHQQSQDQPGAKVEPSRRTTAPDRRAHAVHRRRGHQTRDLRALMSTRLSACNATIKNCRPQRGVVRPVLEYHLNPSCRLRAHAC
jgi:hypothetical protein